MIDRIERRATSPIAAALIACVALGAAALAGGCGQRDGDAPSQASATATNAVVPAQTGQARQDIQPAATPARQTAFRVRSEFDVALNADIGWANETNQPAKVLADQPFRLRLEIEHPVATPTVGPFALELRRNGGDWQPVLAENFPQPAKVHELSFAAPPESSAGTPLDWRRGDVSASAWQEAPEGGHLRIAPATGAALALGRHDVHWAPVEIAAELRLPAGTPSAGLVFYYRDDLNHDRIDLEPGRGLHVVQVRDGQEMRVATRLVDVAAARWTELKVILAGPGITVEYDDEALVFTERLATPIDSLTSGVFVPEGGALELRTLVIEGLPRSPRASIVAAASFKHGTATEDRLAGSAQPFVGGAGISFARQAPARATPMRAGQPGHTEWEFPLVIRHFSDGAARNNTGDRFDFRVIDPQGYVLPASATATVTLNVPAGHLGGTFVETPGRIGPWEATSGDYYFLMEPAETDNLLMAVKSVDGGASWREMDGEHRPATGDLEGFASVLAGDRIHMLHQTSDDVVYHVFLTSDHPTQPDRWAIRDELLASPAEPPTQVADLAVRSDGSVVAVYGGPEKIHYRQRSPKGVWSDETVIDAGLAPDLSGPMLLRDPHDVVHLAYTGNDGTAWYRQLRPDGELTPRRLLAEGLGTGSGDVGAILPLVYLRDSGTISVIYRLADGRLWERRIGPDEALAEAVQVTRRAVVQNAVDADQVGADAIGYGDGVHVLFIEADTGRLFYTHRAPGGDWAEAQLQVEGDEVQWVRGGLLGAGGDSPEYGYVYDAGSEGGSGMNRFRRLALPRQATD